MAHGCPDCGDRLCPGHGTGGCATPDPRDAEIARLRAALAAGPAALRANDHLRSEGFAQAAEMVEAAQERALKE